MTKTEFISILQRTLSGRVHYTIVNENVSYYENYIDMEIRKGRSEEEVLSQLGDPRLIAKTIIGTNTDTKSGDAVNADIASDKEEPNWKKHGKSTIIVLLIVLTLFVVFQLLGALLVLLLPIAFPAALLWIWIRYLREK